MLALALVLLSLPVTVDGCYDADTCRISISQPTIWGVNVVLPAQAVRLCDINAPELRGPTSAEGIKSRDALISWIAAAKAIEFQPALDKNGQASKDKYGRWLGWLVADGIELNARLVKEGYAVVYREQCPR